MVNVKQFFVALLGLFIVLFLVYIYRTDSSSINDQSGIKIYASGSFISDWGPGPELKKIFETQTGFKVTFLEMSDPGLSLQKINLAGIENDVDLVIGLDQYDLMRYSDRVEWKNIFDLQRIYPNISRLNNVFFEQPNYKKSGFENSFIPYDWSAISFVTKKENALQIKKLDDLLKSDYKNKFGLQDPRTSSPGLQFLMWVVQSYSEEEAIEFLKKINTQTHSFSPSWTVSYGLFKNKSIDSVLSYITSPVYHLVEEKDSSYVALDFEAGLPLQIEFMGLLEQCKNCDLAKQFIAFLQSSQAQKIIMNKNYMLPMDMNVVESTAFDTLKIYQLLAFKFYSKEEINKWLSIWSEIRKNEG